MTLPRCCVVLAAAVFAARGGAQPVQRSVESAASLLRLEDRRENDAAVIESAARDPNPAIRRRAVLAAGRIGDRRAIPVLLRALVDRDTSVAATAAFALGLLRDTSTVQRLAAELRSNIERRATVIGEAAQALSRMPTDAGKRAVEELLASTVRTRAATAMVPSGRLALRAAIGDALLAASRFPRPLPTNAIRLWLASSDTAIRWRAAYALSRRPDPAGTVLLVRSVGDPMPLVRSFAMRALTAALADSAGVPRDSAVRILIRGSTDRQRVVSVAAVRALGSYDSPPALQRLMALAGGRDEYLALSAAEALGQLATRASSAAGALRSIALDTRKPVALRATALASLAAIDRWGAVAVADTLLHDRSWRLRAAAVRAQVRAVVRGGEPNLNAANRILGFIRDRDGRIAAAAMDAVVNGTDDIQRMRRLLLFGLESHDVGARAAAIGGLGRIGDTADAPLLLGAYSRALEDRERDALTAAIDALGSLAKKSSVIADTFFRRIVRPDDFLIRRRAAAAFGDSIVVSAWGSLVPIETRRPIEDYTSLARDAATNPRRRARIVTDRGTIELELFAADAPLTVESFLTLALRKFFDGQEWPRVVPAFVTQGGDPRGDQSGGPGYAIRDEINRHRYLTGMLGMALSGPETGGSQWFITHSPQPHLDGGYTIFGRVVRGMDVATRLLQGDRILRIEPVAFPKR